MSIWLIFWKKVLNLFLQENGLFLQNIFWRDEQFHKIRMQIIKEDRLVEVISKLLLTHVSYKYVAFLKDCVVHMDRFCKKE